MLCLKYFKFGEQNFLLPEHPPPDWAIQQKGPLVVPKKAIWRIWAADKIFGLVNSTCLNCYRIF